MDAARVSGVGGAATGRAGIGRSGAATAVAGRSDWRRTIVRPCAFPPGFAGARWSGTLPFPSTEGAARGAMRSASGESVEGRAGGAPGRDGAAGTPLRPLSDEGGGRGGRIRPFADPFADGAARGTMALADALAGGAPRSGG